MLEKLNHSLGNSNSAIILGGLEVIIPDQVSTITGISREEFGKKISKILSRHTEILSGKSGKIFKNAPETAVTLVEVPELPVLCVKQFNDRGLLHSLKGLFRQSHGSRTFGNGLKLISNGIPAATPLALIRKRAKGLITVEWVIMEFMRNHIELDRYLLGKFKAGWTRDQQKSAVRQFGRFIGSMHSKGIFHSDLKTCNIMVSEGSNPGQEYADALVPETKDDSISLRFCLIDYDDVRFSHHLSMRSRIKNMVQIFLSTPLLLNGVERMRFLDEYALHAGLNSSEKKRLAHDVIKKCQGKDILYVGFNGDVIEPLNPKQQN